MYVAPLVGAWIEIACSISYLSRHLSSLPSWERGLKFRQFSPADRVILSLPSWERGLKSLFWGKLKKSPLSLPSWERGLKYAVHGYCIVATGRSPRGSVD